MALSSLFTGLSGIQAHQTRTNVVADNISNINTTGFKARRASFETLLAQTLKQATGAEGETSGTNPVRQVSAFNSRASILPLPREVYRPPVVRQTWP